jgi:AcrR family transcriptional regulator
VANRARILAAAVLAFEDGANAVSLDEIARRAGVGAGTVHRHFPTRGSLIDAAMAQPVELLAARAAELDDLDDPTVAFYVFIEELVVNGAAAHALADRLRNDASDPDAALAEPIARLRASIEVLLRRAQQAGGVRQDVDGARLEAFIAAAHAAYVHPNGGRAAISMLADGLKTRPGG